MRTLHQGSSALRVVQLTMTASRARRTNKVLRRRTAGARINGMCSPAKCYRAMCSIPRLPLDLISHDGIVRRLGGRGALSGWQLNHRGLLSRP
jgi:hypothetical protein